MVIIVYVRYEDIEFILFFFFFKQKTAYEIGVRLVGSEMCIRDRTTGVSGRVQNGCDLARLSCGM